MEVPSYPKACEKCVNNGMYTCKMILIDDKCMFYKEETDESKQEINIKRSSRDKKLYE